MDERLSRSNRLPGSEKLTRPEEIGQLSKYLKSIKEVYEESTRLEDQVLGVSGYSTGKIPKIDKLGKKTVRTPDNQGERADLSEKILGIPGKKIKDRLENKRLKLGDTRTNKLDDEKVKAPDNQGGKVSRLEEVVKKIKDIRDQKLGDKKLILLDERNLALEDTRLDLQAMINTSLENKRINLEDKQEIELVEKKVRLEDENIPELSDTRLNLKDTRETTLDNKILEVEGETKEIELGDKRLDIQDVKIQSLETKRIGLSAEEKIELGNKKLEIKDSGNIELGEKQLKIWDDRNLDLPNTKLKLEDSRETELRNKKVELEDTRTIRLEDKKAELEDDRETELREKRIDLEGIGEIGLEEKKIELVDENVTSLSDKLLWLTNEKETELEDTRLKIEDDRKPELEDKRVDLDDVGEIKLEDKQVELEDDREIGLSEKKIRIEDKNVTSLSDKLLSLLDNREPELTKKRIELEDLREIGLEDEMVGVSENVNGEPTELYDEFLGVPENENGEPEELYSQFIGIEENHGTTPESLSEKILRVEDNKGTTPDDLSDKILKVEENHGTEPNIFNAESLREYTASLSDSELYEFAMSLVSEGNNGSGDAGGWLEKVGSLMSAYLSSDILTPKRAIEFRDAINNTLEASYFGSQAALRVPVDTSSGTIWAKAEEAIGEQLTGTNRRDALDEMIVKMVDYKKSNLPSLPGSDLIDATKGALKNVVGTITGRNDHPNPMNKPLHLNGLALPGGYGDTLYQAANNRTSFDSIDTDGDLIGNTFYKRYWSSKSFKTTLEDLCPIVGKAPIASLTELKALLKSSPYFTSPGKFTTDTKGSYNTFSLDTNMYWEVVLEPFCCDEGPCSNGGYSFLPPIQEINYLNRELHGVSTNYGYWAPINSFELQKSKLSTKSLPLYEGEITYPTGMEFTNELRLTFVDDAWKSWKKYFERCAEVAVYNSIAHFSSDYESTNPFDLITKIDKTNICIASYKNLAFNIKIYILNPQLNTIKKYDLLCVLKDYAEEYVGEIESGGTDLNVTFSIVGENPEEDISKQLKKSKNVVKSLAFQAALEAQKRIPGAIDSSIGLL